ncbi:OmpA family protein [Geoalkalibacter ferrihydriticus]|uniref:OmpA-like domain-containing protein n=2 Tax=Geoalkalibacter ferrihydriticus TaxID=392333 RepID=A0A0C2DVI2_9BACT|nr:OmpA family protein [Geoalkalibacter ferrihydriticus]KIH77449.1 hypothetical protein GFER_01595 [Geoalkalibacter ferrihydriticus DSM 17813]SDM14567.1 OmpA family protein [Geoalkalibacter ferrihydriticus]
MRSLLVGFWIAFLCFAAVAQSPPPEAAETENYFADRRVLGTVNFDQDSHQLTEEGRRAISALVPQLRSLEEPRRLVRIEGFSTSCGNAGDRVTLSMIRANAVGEAIRQRLPKFSPTLTGHAVAIGTAGSLAPDRVEIVLYDNLLDIDTVDIQEAITR